ncbi:MAG TPA: thioredoxin domain-containing protein [Candidatus Obscuribacterales bacterium]
MATCAFPSIAGPIFDQATEAFNAGQYDKAAGLYEQDLRLNPQDPMTHYYFAVSLHCLGRTAEATREYNWILLNTLDPELIRRAQLGLQALVKQSPMLPSVAASMPGAVRPAGAIPLGAFGQSYPFGPAPVGTPPPSLPAGTVPSPQSGSLRSSASSATEAGSPHPASSSSVPAGGSPLSQAPTEHLDTSSPKPLAKERDSGRRAEVRPTIGATGHMRIVDCYTIWCGWCHKFEPLFKQAQTKYKGKITFERIDAEAAGTEDFVKTYKVHSYPTILFFDAEGHLLTRIEGAPQTFPDFDKFITHYFPTVH